MMRECRWEQLEAMLHILADSDDNGCQDSKTKVISFYFSQDRESVENVAESVVEGESAGVQKNRDSLLRSENDTKKVRAESHKEKGAAGTAARPTLKTVEF
jgi:hypothetical protein